MSEFMYIGGPEAEPPEEPNPDEGPVNPPPYPGSGGMVFYASGERLQERNTSDLAFVRQGPGNVSFHTNSVAGDTTFIYTNQRFGGSVRKFDFDDLSLLESHAGADEGYSLAGDDEAYYVFTGRYTFGGVRSWLIKRDVNGNVIQSRRLDISGHQIGGNSKHIYMTGWGAGSGFTVATYRRLDPDDLSVRWTFTNVDNTSSQPLFGSVGEGVRTFLGYVGGDPSAPPNTDMAEVTTPVNQAPNVLRYLNAPSGLGAFTNVA